MFKAQRARKAQEAYAAAHAEWEVAIEALSELLELARSGKGVPAPAGLVFHDGEHLLLEVAGSSLVEDRRGAGRWQGGSQGISFPISSMGGKSVRYRVGRTRGHYVQGEPVATAIDTGGLYVTNERAFFRGSRQSRVCPWSKLLSVQTDADGAVTLASSNRQKVTVVHTGRDVAWTVDSRIRLGIAEWQGKVTEFVEAMQTELETVRAVEPGTGPAAP